MSYFRISCEEVLIEDSPPEFTFSIWFSILKALNGGETIPDQDLELNFQQHWRFPNLVWAATLIWLIPYDSYDMSLELWIPQKSNINDFQWVKTAHYCLKSMNLVVFQVYFHWCVNVSIFLVIRKPDFGACIILYYLIIHVRFWRFWILVYNTKNMMSPFLRPEFSNFVFVEVQLFQILCIFK